MFGQLLPAGGGLPHSLTKPRMIVGRGFNCDVVVPASAISDKHCLLRFKDGYWWVKDLESRHGTAINGIKVSKQRILPNDILCLPKARFRIVYDLPVDTSQMSDESMAMHALTETSPQPTSSASDSPATNTANTTKDSRDAPTTRSPIRKPVPRPDSDKRRAVVAQVEKRAEQKKQERDEKTPSQATSKPIPATRQKIQRQPAKQAKAPSKRFLGKLTPTGGGPPIALLEPNLIVGRSRSCGIRIKASTISSRHCSLAYEDGYWFAEDLGSSNGIRINGEQVDRQILMPGDKLAISTARYIIDYQPVGEPPRDMSMFSKSLLEKAGLQNVLDGDEAPKWVTSHETHDDEDGRIKYRLDDSDPG